MRFTLDGIHTKPYYNHRIPLSTPTFLSFHILRPPKPSSPDPPHPEKTSTCYSQEPMLLGLPPGSLSFPLLFISRPWLLTGKEPLLYQVREDPPINPKMHLTAPGPAVELQARSALGLRLELSLDMRRQPKRWVKEQPERVLQPNAHGQDPIDGAVMSIQFSLDSLGSSGFDGVVFGGDTMDFSFHWVGLRSSA